MTCLTPPLTQVPKGAWACPACVKRYTSAEDLLAARAFVRSQIERCVCGFALLLRYSEVC